MRRLPIGMPVKITGIKDESDRDLNGLTGRVVPRKLPTGFRPEYVFGEVSVGLDKPIDGVSVVNVLRKEVVPL